MFNIPKWKILDIYVCHDKMTPCEGHQENRVVFDKNCQWPGSLRTHPNLSRETGSTIEKPDQYAMGVTVFSISRVPLSFTAT